MFFFPKKSWERDGVYVPQTSHEEVMVVVFGVVDQRWSQKGVYECLGEGCDI